MIEVKNLNVDFIVNNESVHVLNNVSLSIGKNEVVALIGETGCGKSVLGSAILKILPENALVNGSIKYEGREILALGEKEMQEIRGRKIASVPQSPSTSLDPLMKVGSQVAECISFGNVISKAGKRNIARQVMSAFKKLRLPREKDIYLSYPCELSGGMKQRILISMGIVSNPDFLIVDEPTKAVDWPVRKEVISALKELKDDRNCSMLLITHDLGAAKVIADKIAVMYCGEIVETGSTEEIFNNPKHPYTKGLIASAPSKGLNVMEGYMPSFSEDLPPCRFMPRCRYKESLCDRKEAVLSGGSHKVKCHKFCSAGGI